MYSTTKSIGLKITSPSCFRIWMANHLKVKSLGMVEGLDVEVFSVHCKVDCHVLPAGLGAYPLILGRLWLRKVGAIQNWMDGVITVHASSGRKMSFDMISHAEISEAEKREEEDESSTSKEESSLTSESDDVDMTFIGGVEDLYWDKMVVEASDDKEKDTRR